VIDLPSFAKIEPRQEDEDQLKLASDATPLDGLRAIYTNEKIPLSTRMRAMIEAAPYLHPKLTATIAFDGEDLAARLDRANQRMAKGTKEIEQGKEIQATATELEPITATPILPVHDKRYRR
jgi:hypothetical protein